VWVDFWDRLWKERPWIERTAVSEEKPPAEEPKAPPKQIRLSVGDAVATADIPCCEGEKKEKGAAEASGIGKTVLKVAGAAATGITATGFIVVVGAAVFWIRFNEVGLPATQAVGLLSRSELLVQGAQETILYLAIALTVVLLLFFVDPKGRVPRLSLLLLLVLTLAAIVYPLCTALAVLTELLLAVFAIFLFLGCVVIGVRSGSTFWPLALAVFVATLLYAASVGVLIVKEQRYVQAAAVLRGKADAGLTGVYVTATEKAIYLGRVSSIPADEEKGAETRRAMFDVPRAGATYAVGPLESVANAEARAARMLEQLIADRERNPEPPATSGEKPKGGPEEAKAGAKPTAADAEEKSHEPSVEEVAGAFGDSVEIHHTVEGDWTCLVRYAEAGSGMLGHWWTSCAEDEKLAGKTMLGIREKLALPARFHSVYDMRVEATLPAGAPITYLEGEIAPQCEHGKPADCGHEYAGGGDQIYLPKPGKAEGPRRQCTETREDEVPIWGRCDSKSGN
jgi:hypothetical protein